jgi:hypothetical protein
VETTKTSISIEYPITHLGLGDVEDTQFTDRSVHAGETGTTMRIIVTGGNSGIGKATAGNKIQDRVISVGSASYMFGRIRLDDLNRQARKRSMFPAYADSKLAIMLFVHELARRGVRAYVADPGGADTDITRDSTGMWGWWVQLNALPFLAQDPHVAARTTIQAVTTDLPSGTYIAPRFLKLLGAPKVTEPGKKIRDPVMARQLWELSAELTGCDWTVHPPARTPRQRAMKGRQWT